MISFEEALSIVDQAAFKLGNERIDFQQSVNRVLAEDIKSDIQMPPFNKSAVDGYACKKADLQKVMEVIEIIPAGKTPEKNIGDGQCSKIMTGAPVPARADCVIMVEHTENTDENHIRYLKDSVKNNICAIGEDIAQGQVVLKQGTLIKPKHIAVMASAGVTRPLVSRSIRIGIISTGDELIEPHKTPSSSQIRNSNAYQLYAQIEKIGAIPDYVGIAHDNEESTRKMLNRAFQYNDLVLLSGGVSMGDYDFVPKVLRDFGVRLEFDSIAVQPGRPTVFGVRNKQFVFGLPGNPVSSFVQFELLVKPLVYKMSGFDYHPLPMVFPMAADYTRKRSTRLSWMPVKIDEAGEVMPIEYHGSAHINALSDADGLISIPVGQTTLKKGDRVHVRQI